MGEPRLARAVLQRLVADPSSVSHERYLESLCVSHTVACMRKFLARMDLSHLRALRLVP